MNNKDLIHVHSAIAELEQLKSDLQSKSKGKKPTKQRLNYLFTKKSGDDIKKLAADSRILQFSESELARAAMIIGLSEIEKALDDDAMQAVGMLHIAKLKAMFQ